MRALTLSLTLLAAPAFAQDADVAALTAAIEDAGCTVTAENGDAVLAASGLNEEQTMAAVAAMYEAGLVGLEQDGSMTLKNETCE
ncbi:MAG: hypothetical protein ACSHWY_14430 [Octadecabacter sp.]